MCMASLHAHSGLSSGLVLSGDCSQLVYAFSYKHAERFSASSPVQWHLAAISRTSTLMATRKKQIDFEDKIEQLEKLVEILEEGNLGLEEALKSFEQGVKLTRECQLALQNAEQRVRLLEQGDDGEVVEITFAGETDE